MEGLVFQVLLFQVIEFEIIVFEILLFKVLVFQVLVFEGLVFEILVFVVLVFEVLGYTLLNGSSNLINEAEGLDLFLAKDSDHLTCSNALENSLPNLPSPLKFSLKSF